MRPTAPLTLAATATLLTLASRHQRASAVLRRLGRTDVRRLHAPPRMRAAIEDAGLELDVDRTWTAWLALVGGCLTLGPLVAGPTGVLVAAVVTLGPAGYLHLRRDRRAALRRQHLPDLCDVVASALRAGASPTGALRGAATALTGPLAAEVHRCCDEIDRGRPTAEALRRWTGDDDPDVRLVGHVLDLATSHGGRPAAALERAAGVLRIRQDLRRERTALAAQARASAAVMAAAPIVFAFVAGLTDPRSASFLFGRPTGWICLGAGIGLDLVGARWMRRLTRSS